MLPQLGNGGPKLSLIFDQDDIIQLVGFQVGPKLFGVDILTVREILRDPSIDGVDGLPSFIEGIIRLRGEVLPIVNISQLLGLPPESSHQGKTWLLIAEAGGRSVGFKVDAVTPIIRIEIDTILPAPDLILAGLRSKYIRGVCETEKGLLVIVELDQMFLADEIKAMEGLGK